MRNKPQRLGYEQRLAYNKTEAAEALGVSVDFFDAHIASEVACIRLGRRRLYPKHELLKWLERSASFAAVLALVVGALFGPDIGGLIGGG